MNSRTAVLALVSSLGVSSALAQDWPQWRGPNRDAKAADFKAPKTWPKELTQKWKVTVGDGVATPALVGDRLYVFSREQGFEIPARSMPPTARNCGRKNTRRSERVVPPAVSPARAARLPWRTARS